MRTSSNRHSPQQIRSATDTGGVTRRQAVTHLGALLSLPIFAGLAAGRAARPSPGRVPGFLTAVRAGDTSAVRAQLEDDIALARATDDQGRSAYVLAYVHGHVETADVIRAAGLDLDIVEAVLAEDWERMESLGKGDPGLMNRLHPIGGTPLYAGALVGSNSLWRLRMLGCDPEARPEGGTGYTAARGALTASHAAWARIALTDLCGNGSDVNAPQQGGSSVLHGAVMRRDETLVTLAIRKGADVSAKDDEGRTAAALASELGWEFGVKLLANHASLPRDNRGSRFLLDANREPIVRPDLSDIPQATQSEVTSNSHFNLAKVRQFVASDKRLVYSISSDDELAIEASAHIGNRPIMQFHLDQGAPLSLPTAVSMGDIESVKFWLNRDQTLVHERGAHDFPIMFYAALGGGSVEMAEVLLSYGASVNQESKGTTVLHWCARRKDHDLAKWLVENGADPEAVSYSMERDGQTPLQLAMAAGDTKMVGILKDA